jgi:hypothetical protein
MSKNIVALSAVLKRILSIPIYARPADSVASLPLHNASSKFSGYLPLDWCGFSGGTGAASGSCVSFRAGETSATFVISQRG